MEAEEKARQLVNMYYSCAKSQSQAVEMVERVLLGALCERIVNLHDHMFNRKDYDAGLISSSIQQLKWWQEVAVEVDVIKKKIPV